jgi:hypothetical protein
MEQKVIDVVRKALRESDPPGSVLLELEKLGDAAFDEIRQRLRGGGLSSREEVNALRRLSLLTRQACLGRKEEVLELAIERLSSDSRIVRSGAVHMVIATTLILEEYPTRASKAENRPGAVPSLRKRVQADVARAVERGIEEREVEFARRFLADVA